MRVFKGIIDFSINRPKIVVALVAVLAVAAVAQFPKIRIDTDPENMLSEEEFVRIFHNSTKNDD